MEWVNLLRTPEKKSSKPRLNGGDGGGSWRVERVKVLENTPQAKAGVKKSRRSEVQVLRSQVASLAREKRDLALNAAKGGELLNSARDELEVALEVNSQAKTEMEDQRRVVHRLSADNSRLIRQVELLGQQSPWLKSPSITNHTHHPSPSPRDHTHTNNVLVKDLERLSQRATELSAALSSTQQSRTALEKEVVGMKRAHLELQTSRAQLEEALAKSEEERASLYRSLQEREENSRRREEQLQLHMDTAVTEKTAKLEELLSLSERLQAALSSLSHEKSGLEQSLRTEVTNAQQLKTEKQGLEARVVELETSLRHTRQELSHMQDQQLQEVSEMKAILDNEMMSLQQERDLLNQQVEGGQEEREAMEREIEATRAELTEAEREIERLSEKMSILQDTLSLSERDRASELSQLTAQLAEASARSEGLRREMEEERGVREREAREEVERLTNQLREISLHVDQMESEREQLQQLLDTASHDLQAKSRDLDSTHSELHASQMTNTRLEQQVADLESKVLTLNEQITGRTELTNEMRALLEQRSNQIQELEAIVVQQREELMCGSHTHLSGSHTHLSASHSFSGSSTHIQQATIIKSPYGSRPHSPEPHPQATPSNNELVRLRKQLSESHQNALRLEASCGETRTELAKLQGAVQALTTIKERLIDENSSLLDAKRRAEEGRRSAEEGRRRAEEGRKVLSRQLTSLQGTVTSLRSQLAGLQEEKEEAMSQISELHDAYTQRETELAEEMAAMEVQSVAASEQCETGEVERDYLQLELAKARTRNTELEEKALDTQSQISELHDAYTQRETELAEEMAAMEVQSVAASEQCETGEVERDYLQLELAKARTRNTELEEKALDTQRLIETECTELQTEGERCAADLSTLHRDDTQTEDNCRLTAAINAKQTNQIAEKEGHISELLGEVEVLRARKAVVLKWLCNQGDDSSLHLELESVRDQLQHCQATHSAEVTSLRDRLRETERLLEAAHREREGGGRGGGERGVSLDSRDLRGGGGCEGGRRCRWERRSERLRSRLKNQVEQSNYLRVKLGYTLKEVQLYKDLKSQLASQLDQQGLEMAALQEQYRDCLTQLQHVERLGFQATLLPSNTV